MDILKSIKKGLKKKGHNNASDLPQLTSSTSITYHRPMSMEEAVKCKSPGQPQPRASDNGNNFHHQPQYANVADFAPETLVITENGTQFNNCGGVIRENIYGKQRK